MQGRPEVVSGADKRRPQRQQERASEQTKQNEQVQMGRNGAPAAIDQRTLYEGNSVLRGGQTPRIEQPGRPADDLFIT